MTDTGLLAPLKTSKTPPKIDYDDDKHKYWIDKVEVPSVSAILETTSPKPALVWWGMRVGIGAVIKLLQESTIKWPVLQAHVYEEVLTGIPDKSPSRTRGKGARAKLKTLIEAEILDARLDTNNIKSDAGDRGTLVHEAIERLGTHDLIPDINEYEEEFRGYIRAIARWWMNLEPEFHRQEVIVGSRKHAFAGRFDLDATCTGYGRTLTDFKTSKTAYESHFEQLALYDLAEQEMNTYLTDNSQHVHFDHRLVVVLRPDGEYEVHTADHVGLDTAIAAVNLHHARVRDAARKKKR